MPVIQGLSGKRWPAHPHRLDDELLSSWMTRTAYANRLKLQTFTVAALGKDAAIWNRDIDRSATDDVLHRLGEQTGASVEDLSEGMLASYESRLFARHNINGPTKWILPLGIRARKRRLHGMQFCPLCLFFDAIPYFRRRWRLSIATICDVHGTMLHDRCPKCGESVIFFRNDMGLRSGYRIGDLVSCWKCDFDLRRAPAYSPEGPDGKTVLALRSLITFPDLGWWFQGGRTLHYGPLYFDVLHHLLQLIATAPGRRLLDVVECETGWRLGDVPKGSFEHRPIGERHALLVTALWLLDEWPERFVDAARAARLSQSRVIHGMEFPYWFESEVCHHLAADLRTPTTEEARSAARYLKAHGSALSTAAVGRLIGSKDSDAAKHYAKKTVEPLTDGRFEEILDWLDREIHKGRPRTAKRLLLQRDKVIVRLIRLTGWPATRILRLTTREAAELASTPCEQRTVPSEAVGMLLCYLRDTRQYLKGEDSGDALFIGWKRGGIGEKAWELRWKALRESGRH